MLVCNPQVSIQGGDEVRLEGSEAYSFIYQPCDADSAAVAAAAAAVASGATALAGAAPQPFQAAQARAADAAAGIVALHPTFTTAAEIQGAAMQQAGELPMPFSEAEPQPQQLAAAAAAATMTTAGEDAGAGESEGASGDQGAGPVVAAPTRSRFVAALAEQRSIADQVCASVRFW